jgi:hypothetical protein
MGTDPIFVTQFSGAGTYTAGTGLSLTGTQFAVSLVPIANGGTGQTTANAALNAFLPSQATNANKYLRTDGTNTSWQNVPSPNNGTLTMGVSGTGLSGSATFTADQSGNSTFTIASNATSANTVSTIVARDASGNFSAGTVTAALSGNATTATTLQTARTINGTSFNGSADITITAANPNALTLGTYLTGTSYNGSAAVTATVDATSANTASKVVARDASGNFSAGTITAALNGNASTATTATTATTANATAQALTAGTYLTSTGTFNGSTGRTFAVDATSVNTASKVVARDASGNFSAGTITAALNGNASTATSATSATNATNVNLTNDTTTNATHYFVFGDITSGNDALKVSSTKATFNPSTGTAVFAGDVTSSSDERLKTNWRPVQEDFVTKLAGVKSGVYDRTDIEATQAGVSAQSLEKVLSEVVMTAPDGLKSVNYGNAALVAAIELAKQVVELRKEIAELKGKL